MIDADAMRTEWLENGENEYVYDTNAVLDSIDQQPTIEPPRWIPASEPPKESGEYIVMIRCGRKATTLQYSVENDAWFDYSDDADEDSIIYYPITHWMPLPEGPKEDE